MTRYRDDLNAGHYHPTTETPPNADPPATATTEGETVEQLRDQLRQHGLAVSGTKDELKARLEAHGF
jgi:hypothetical protein